MGFAPTPMTSFPVRNGESLKIVMKQSYPPEEWHKVQELAKMVLKDADAFFQR